MSCNLLCSFRTQHIQPQISNFYSFPLYFSVFFFFGSYITSSSPEFSLTSLFLSFFFFFFFFCFLLSFQLHSSKPVFWFPTKKLQLPCFKLKTWNHVFFFFLFYLFDFFFYFFDFFDFCDFIYISFNVFFSIFFYFFHFFCFFSKL